MATSPYKPSPLSFGSPRTSPFKRPQSPLTQSPSTVRGGTGSPTASPEKRYGQASSPASVVFTQHTPPPAQPVFQSPRSNTLTMAPQHDPLTRLPPPLLHTMRESFHLLANDTAGAIARADVADMLGQLGQDASPATLNQFFPAGQPQTLNLAAYLQTLAALVGGLSPPEELGAAFAAFDADDSGQVDVEELRSALLSMPGGEAKLTEREIGSVLDGFAGRRALAKGMGADAGRRGEVFRYQEFMASMLGAGKVGSNGELVNV